jgi:2-methylisocitrate lyase-like PEP mutase family enzyme
MLRGGRTPILSNAELGELGFAMVMHGITPLFRVVSALQETLSLLKRDRLHDAPGAVSFDEFKEIVGLPGWAAIEEEFGREG